MIAGYPVWVVALICVGVFVAGIVDAIGGGGGLITVPVYLLAGLPTHLALGTNKLASCLGTTASTSKYIRSGCVNWLLAIPSVALALLGAHLGTRLQLLVNETVLRYVLIAVLFAAAAVMLKRKPLPETPGDIAPWKQRTIVWGASFVIGMYDGFYGPGTGTFLLIVFCRLAKMDLRTASGNVKIVNLSSNLGALLTALLAKSVLVPLGLIAAVFSFAGNLIGANLLLKNGAKLVKPVILAVLGLLLLRLILELSGINFG